MGAPDFYFAYNATFRHIREQFGEEALRQYWLHMGREHFAHVTRALRERGLEALQEHWEELFAEEPGAQVSTTLHSGELELRVEVCPAWQHLRACGRQVDESYCDHCLWVSRGMCEPAGVQVTIDGGEGRCIQHFRRATGKG
jgi:hypothetical protein